MKKKTKIILIVTGVIVALIAIVGVSNVGKVKPMSEKEYMIEIVKTHKKEIERDVMHGDEEHHIHSVTIEYDTVKRNPMGGFMFNGYVNGNKDLFFRMMVDKKNDKLNFRIYTCANELLKWKGMI